MSDIFKKIRKFLFQNYFRFKRPMTMGVRVIAQNNQGHICLIRHTYIDGWHLPGGGIEKGETAIMAAIKELHEEAGLLSNESAMKLLSIHANFPYFKGDHVILYHTDSFEKIAVNNAHEIAECGFFAPDNLPKGTTRATIERINEFINNKPFSQFW